MGINVNDSNTRGANDLVKFLDWMGQKGLINNSTGSALKSTCSRVFGILDPVHADVFSVDLDSLMRRFANLNPGVTPDSLQTYRSRIQKSLRMFEQYLEDPVNFKVGDTVRAKNATGTEGTTAKLKAHSRASTGGDDARDTKQVSNVQYQTPPPQDTLNYPFPLRRDITVMVSNIPRDLKQSEAKRLADFLHALAEEDPS